MPFQPRLKEEIERDLLSRLIALSDLESVEDASPEAALLGTNAEEFERVEQRLWRIKEAFFLRDEAGGNLTGEELDERVRELPPPGIRRQGSSAASAPAVRLKREDTSQKQTVAAGAVFGRSDQSGVLYVLQEDVTFSKGDDTAPKSSNAPAAVTANVPGNSGNAPQSGTIDTVREAPGFVTAVNQVQPVTGGEDRETDSRLIQRALEYLGSLASVQPAALRFLALTHQSSNGIRIRHAAVFEQPAYTELVVDDGTGFAGFTKSGQVTSGTIPDGGARVLYHEPGAVDPIKQVTLNSVTYVVEMWTTSIEERGILNIHPNQTVISAGDTWKIENYTVYTGPIRELQAKIEGDPNDPFNSFGARASGARVKVVRPDVSPVDFEITFLVTPQGDLEEVKQAIQDETVTFMRDLAPGEPLFLAQLIDQLMAIEGTRNVTINKPTDEVHPGNPRTVLRTTADKVQVG